MEDNNVESPIEEAIQLPPTCRHCCKLIKKEVTRCKKCNEAFHPSCAAQSGGKDGIIRACCGRPSSRANSPSLLIPSPGILGDRAYLDDKIGKLAELIQSVAKNTNDKIDSFRSELVEMNSRIEGNHTKIVELASKMDHWAPTLDKMPALVREVAKLKSDIDVDKLCAERMTSSGESSIDAIAVELQDRLSRSCNLLIHNLPDNNSVDNTTDQNAATNLLSKVSDINVVSCRRIGKKLNAQKPRPLLITLGSQHEVARAIKNRSKLPQDISISRDRTMAQRKQLEKLRAEVESFNSSSVHKKTIRFIHGVPKILDVEESPAGPSSASVSSKN